MITIPKITFTKGEMKEKIIEIRKEKLKEEGIDLEK